MGTPLGVRFISGDLPTQRELAKEAVERFSIADEKLDLWTFSDEQQQALANEAREDGWVVLRSACAVDNIGFMKLQGSQFTFQNMRLLTTAMQWAILPKGELSMLKMCSSRHKAKGCQPLLGRKPNLTITLTRTYKSLDPRKR